jgi:8-oxo-dGTP pyrophosphatase MutT (NUDIX family)
MKNYIKKIRSKIGSDKFIHPAARIIVENDKNEVLIIERADNGRLGIPAGALEEAETIEQCIVREVYEETGLTLVRVEIIGISSNPDLETVNYPNGDTIQYFTVEFYSNAWTGQIKMNDPDEVLMARFVDKKVLEDLPSNELAILKSLRHYQETGKIMLR